jgi:hypothetical protein
MKSKGLNPFPFSKPAAYKTYDQICDQLAEQLKRGQRQGNLRVVMGREALTELVFEVGLDSDVQILGLPVEVRHGWGMRVEVLPK